MAMEKIREILELREKVFKKALRFHADERLYKHCYFSYDRSTSRLIELREKGSLKAYAIYRLTERGELKWLEVLDMCAIDENAMSRLMRMVVKEAICARADVVGVWYASRRYRTALARSGFLESANGICFTALLDPLKLLNALSSERASREPDVVMGVIIKGHPEITVGIKGDEMGIVEGLKPDFFIKLDEETFIRLFLGQTSPLKELLSGRLSVSKLRFLPVVLRFFRSIRHDEWYIPAGDRL